MYTTWPISPQYYPIKLKHQMEDADLIVSHAANQVLDTVSMQPSLGRNTGVSQRTGGSCHACRRKKIRCDKRSPCSQCIRGRRLCQFPAPEKKPRRPHKTTITDVAARVSQLEETIATISDGRASGVPVYGGHVHPLGEGVDVCRDKDHASDRQETASLQELLIQNGESSYYVNEALLSRILEEERDLQFEMGTSMDNNPLASNTTSFDIGAPFSDFRKWSSHDPFFHPSRWDAIHLWRAYVTNCDPFCKVLHLPTMETSVFEAVSEPASVSPDFSALMFSIYFAATTSLTSAAVSALLGKQKLAALTDFKRGLEQSLASCDFLDTPTVISLQAMAIYLYSLRAYNLGRSTWTLYGLAMRSARSIGLHRDGKNFRLSPFQAELRRRLWWAMCVAEARAAEDHGISVPIQVGNSSDTHFPSNLDDMHITPDMARLPRSKSGWTTMTYSLVLLEMNIVLPCLYGGLDTCSWGSSPEILRNHMDNPFEYLQDKYLSFCNPNIPTQRATILTGRLLAAKTVFIKHQYQPKGADSTGTTFTATEEFLANACEILEMNLQLETDDLLRDFHWIYATYTQYHPLTYALWHLCVDPASASADRAWRVIDQVFETRAKRPISLRGDRKWIIIQLLKRKACLQRQESVNQQEVTVAQQKSSPPSEAISPTPGADKRTEFRETSSLDVGTTDFSDWSYLLDNSMYEFGI